MVLFRERRYTVIYYNYGKVCAMRTFNKSHKLDNVCYDIRGPVMDEANRMIANGEKILKLNIGNPAPFGFRAPDEVIETMQSNLTSTEGYSDSKGLLSARQAIADYCVNVKHIAGVTPDDVYTGNGASELITLSMQGLLDNGDEVLVPAPDYPLWTASVTLAGGKAVHYICDESAGWFPDIDDIRSKITPRTKGIVIINPNNPTGALYSRDLLEQIAQIARENELIVFSDEIYDRLVMDGPSLTSSPATAAAGWFSAATNRMWAATSRASICSPPCVSAPTFRRSRSFRSLSETRTRQRNCSCPAAESTSSANLSATPSIPFPA